MRFFRTFDNLSNFDNLSLMGHSGGEFNPDFRFGIHPLEPFLHRETRFDTTDPTFMLPVGRGWAEDALNLRVSMPAIAESDFSVSRIGQTLTIRGERKAPEDFGREGMADFALRYGAFERTIELPSGLNFDEMKAKFHHGVLDVRIPILSEAKAKAVPVMIGEEEKVLAGAAA